MIQRLDERFAASERVLAELVERTERLDRRARAQDEELAAQRVALARLDRALGRTLPHPVRERGPSDAPPSPPRPS
jgi:adenylosuccinate lyase